MMLNAQDQNRSSVSETIADFELDEEQKAVLYGSGDEATRLNVPQVTDNRMQLPPIPRKVDLQATIAEMPPLSPGIPSQNLNVGRPCTVNESPRAWGNDAGDIGSSETAIISSPNALFDREMLWAADVEEKLPKAGDRIAHYEIISELGRGGFGVVYRVRNLVLDRDEALKLILPSAKNISKDIDKRFERELNIASRLEHPNIVRLYSTGSFDGNMWMSMELIEGVQLMSIMGTGWGMPFERAKKIMLQILSGLQEAHQREIVHRDLKPANIMISRKHGYDELIVILDFGLSKAIGHAENANVQNVTMSAASNCVFGTPSYMAPEQFDLGGIVSPCVDVYAAGIIFLELLTGTQVFTGTPVEVAAQQRVALLKFPEHLKNTAVAAVIEKACEKMPAKRYQNAGEFYDALLRIESILDPPEVLNAGDNSGGKAETSLLWRLADLPEKVMNQWPILRKVFFYAGVALVLLLIVLFVLLITGVLGFGRG
ncbi:MAG: serine/threonine protein kinase [Proteobacteria bacterium]|nr:serine/threonine protein kinase [Pseudomonadota bacterium]